MKTCTECGGPLPEGSTARRKYCDDDTCVKERTARIQRAWQAKRRLEGRPQSRTAYTHVCESCGETFTGGAKSARFCSQKCNAAAQDRVALSRLGSPAGHKALSTPTSRPCKTCGEEFAGIYSHRFCSKICKYLNSRPDRVDLFILDCIMCDRRFASPVFGRAYCSSTCREKRLRGWRKHLPALLVEHEGLCWLCLYPVDASWGVDNPLCAEIDHLIPRARGGGNEYSNLALAHRECNFRRQDQIDVVWMNHPLL